MGREPNYPKRGKLAYRYSSKDSKKAALVMPNLKERMIIKIGFTFNLNEQESSKSTGNNMSSQTEVNMLL